MNGKGAAMLHSQVIRRFCLTFAAAVSIIFVADAQGQGHDEWIGPHGLNGYGGGGYYYGGIRGYHPRGKSFTPFEYHRMNLPPKRYLHHTDSPIYFQRHHKNTSDYWWYDYDAFWSRESFYPPNARPEDYDFSSEDEGSTDMRFDGVRSPRFDPDAGRGLQREPNPSDLVHLIPPPPGIGVNQMTPTFEDKAWNLLAEGDALKALGRFAAQRLLAPHSGRAHLGYALAAGKYGDESAAISAMRDALRIDPNALDSFPEDESLHLAVRSVLDGLMPKIEVAGQPGRDAAFFCAALSVLIGDHEQAVALARPVLAVLDEGAEPEFTALRSALVARVGEKAFTPEAIASTESLPLLIVKPISE